MATIKTTSAKHGKTRYRVQVRTNGVYASKTFSNKAEAETWACTTENKAKLNTMGTTAQATTRTVGEMIERYCLEILRHKARNTQASQRGQLEWWKSRIGNMTLAKATTPIIAEGKKKLLPRGNATINSYLAALQHVYEIAIKEWQWCEINPVRNVWRQPLPQARVRMLSDLERAKLLFYCRLVPCQTLETIVILALSTGPRKSEIRFMRFSDYDHLRGRIVLNETQNGQRRTVRLFGEARCRMAALYEARSPEQEFFFPSEQNPNHPIDFRYSWEMALEKAEIPDFCFHDLRHSAASYLAAQGASLADIKEILGHKTIQTTQKYTHLTENHTAALVQRMNLRIF